MFNNDRHGLHTVRKKWFFPRKGSRDRKVLICSNFLGTRVMMDRRHIQMSEVDRKKDRRREEEEKTEQADGHYY